MKKLLLSLIVSCCVIFTSFANSDVKIGEQERIKVGYKHDLSKVLNGIIYVESKGDINAISKNKKCVGILQITPILIKECNRIIGKSKFTLNDRYDKSKSFEMFYIIQKYYNKNGDIRKAAYIWRGGNSKQNQHYFNMVKKQMK